MVRIGLIGCGEHSEIGHAIPLSRYKAAHPDEVELTAVCDPRRERSEAFQKKYGFINAYSSMDEMLSRHKLEACIAVVPVEKISQIGIKLLESGMPCVIEKPLGGSLADAKQLLEAAAKTGTQNMVSVNRRFMPALNRAIEWSHESGELRYVRCTMSRHARTEPEFLWATAVHAVDTLRFIAGNVAQAKIRKLNTTHSYASWYAVDLEFENGVHGRIDVVPTAGMLEETYELLGQEFRAIVTAPFGPERGFRCYRENRLVLRETNEGTPEDVVSGFYDEAVQLIRALSQNAQLCPTIADVYPSVDFCHAMARSAREER
jgi:predicted dehydrogenase